MRHGPCVDRLPLQLALEEATADVSVVDKPRTRGRGVAARLAGGGALAVGHRGNVVARNRAGTVRGVDVVLKVILQIESECPDVSD